MKANELDQVQCPFYKMSTDLTIICEGIIPETQDSIRYKRSGDKTKQIRTYCCGCYQKCERFDPISAKYEE